MKNTSEAIDQKAGTIEVVPDRQVATRQPATPSMLLQMAVEQGADIDKLEQLMALQERWEAAEAKKAYVAAMSAFRESVPAIIKSRRTNNSAYAGLAESISTIRPALSANGLSHSWRTSQAGGLVTVTCCVTHIHGHAECTALEAAPDTGPGRNSIQAVGSTVSYLERYTLYAILGLASTDQDNDGAGAKPRITDAQVLEIEAMISDNGLDLAKFKKWLSSSLKADSIDDIAADAFPAVIRQIKASVKAHQKDQQA